MRITRFFSTIDTHTGGEPTRTIIGGLPFIPGKTIIDKMTYLNKNMDWVRTALLFEPRGHSGMAGAILTESALSFLGIGVQPPTPSWGNMLIAGKQTLGTAWWLSVFPGLAILVTVLGYNLLGEGLRDAMDPRIRD